MSDLRFPGRIRSLYPAQWQDADFVELSFEARLFVLALRNFADDNGIFEWRPKQLKMYAFPADNVDPDLLLNTLEKHDFIRKYTADNGLEYAMIRNFALYQKPRKPTFKHPIPEFTEIKGYAVHTQYGTSTVPVPHQCGKSDPKYSIVKDSIVKDNISPPAYEEIISIWNTTAKPLNIINRDCTLTAKRKTVIKERLRANKDYVVDFRQACEQLKDSAFLKGEKSDWKADLDFMLRPDSVTKILEGNYTDKAPKKSKQHYKREPDMWG